MDLQSDGNLKSQKSFNAVIYMLKLALTDVLATWRQQKQPINTTLTFFFNAWIRLHNIFVFHNGHYVRSGDHSAINSCHVLVGRLATLQV